MKPFLGEGEGERMKGAGERSRDMLLMMCMHAYGGLRLMSGPSLLSACFSFLCCSNDKIVQRKQDRESAYFI